MRLSRNFTLIEMVNTWSCLPNIPSASDIARMRHLAMSVLQPLHDLYGKPIKINSGFRAIAVNREQGGRQRPRSQHCKGEAVDLVCIDNAQLFNMIREHLSFDQLIWVGGNDQQPEWVHVSYKIVGNRHQVLRSRKVAGRKRFEQLM